MRISVSHTCVKIEKTLLNTGLFSIGNWRLMSFSCCETSKLRRVKHKNENCTKHKHQVKKSPVLPINRLMVGICILNKLAFSGIGSSLVDCNICNVF